MKLSKEHIERLREMLARPGQRIVVVSHTNPDGDAVGSSLAWAEVLRTMGHAVTCVVPNKYPYFLDWMPGIDEVVIFKTDTEGRARRAIAEADMIFCLDFNAVSRLEILSDTIAANTTARRVLIDHHLSPDEGFDLMFSHPDSSSTCFLVYSIVEAMCGAAALVVTGGRLEAFYRTDAAHERLGRTMAEHVLAEVYERLLERYAASPQQRYEALLERCPDLLQMVSLRELASYLGVRPETLSRIRGRIR